MTRDVDVPPAYFTGCKREWADFSWGDPTAQQQDQEETKSLQSLVAVRFAGVEAEPWS